MASQYNHSVLQWHLKRKLITFHPTHTNKIQEQGGGGSRYLKVRWQEHLQQAQLTQVSPPQTHICEHWAVVEFSTIICWGFSHGHEEPEASSVFDHLPNVWSQWIHFTLFGSIKGPLMQRVPTLQNKNLPAAEAPQWSNQWAIRFPLISLARLDVDVNQSHISSLVFLLIASLRSGCISFRLWSLSANEVRKAYGSCFQPGSAES